MARQNEKECTEELKNAFLGKTNVKIYANCELETISQILFSAKSNVNKNNFPDFVFSGGGIEHFQLTSSKETRKGSEFKIEESINKKSKDEYFEMLKEEHLNSEFIPGTIATDNYEEVYESFSYEAFIHSLERNIVNHVESLEKSNYQDKVVVFLMEQQTARLWIDEGIIPIKFYELHRDKKALSIIKQHCNSVNYIIYFVADSVEVLDLSKMDDLLNESLIYKNVKGGRLVKHQLNLLINL
jgi:hypothetical protein